ncbi:hypothetical protein ACHHYP_13456 [Achlya hypogyna]|uniref:Uncharacterized protein n=1 Tax=Achlya hypogyna TaxID=1202772 RepID=A0A1V9YF87_ACHHY|nr:hypothetical protein ACHHYP_13456 [Achlya hypogyna]
MLQFLHGKPLTGLPATHFRSFSQDLVFLPKGQAALGLNRAMDMWETRMMSIMPRVVQATSRPDIEKPEWTQPSVELLTRHYYPWGPLTICFTQTEPSRQLRSCLKIHDCPAAGSQC